MKLSFSWLKEYIPQNISVNEAADLLTFAGLEVEGVEKTESIKGGLDKYYIGEVLTCTAHPNSDHLHITTVDVGFDEPLHIVCGAPNVDKGQKVVVATEGAVVYSENDSFVIKKSKLRGEVSQGMICSAKELQLSDDNSGILVLPEQAKAGTPAKEYFNIQEDYTLEIGLTANRCDAASHIGTAYDLVAVLNIKENTDKKPLIPDVSDFKAEKSDKQITFDIDSSLCPRYSGVCMSGIKVEQSPQWLRNRLNSVGIRPINNIVDVTNFVMMECGQPLHAFDLRQVKGNKIQVKTLKEGTLFTTLDSVERKLNGKEAVVCNESEPMALAGIFGGLNSGIKDDTTEIFIESAYFNPVVVRKAAKYHQLSTDASFRYERGANPQATIWALQRAVLLIKQLCGAEVCSEVYDIYPETINPVNVVLRYSYLDNLCGQHIEKEKIKNILHSLNFTIENENDGQLSLLVPTSKSDVTRECDVAEEILRIYGYDNISFSQKLNTSLSFSPKPDREKIQSIITSYLASNGFNEIMNNSLTSKDYYIDNEDYPIEKSVSLINALSNDLALMRQTLLYSGLEVVAFNLNRKISDIKIFEFGNCYQKVIGADESLPSDKRYSEQNHLSLFTTGNLTSESWQGKAEKTNFFYLKNIVLNVLRRLRIDISKIEIKDSDTAFYSEGIKLINKDNKKDIALIGIISSAQRKRFSIKQDVYYADMYWDNILKMLPKKDVVCTDVAKYPEVRRDLALIIDTDVKFEDIEKVAFESEKKLLKRINLFDEYKGLNITGKKQYAVSFILQDKDKTLTDKQIDAVMDKILKNLTQKLNASIRS